MSSLAATQSDGYYLPPEYYESGAYLKQTRNQFAAAAASKNNNNNSINGTTDKKIKTGHNQWLKHGIVRFVLQEKVRKTKKLWFLFKRRRKRNRST